MKSKIKKKGRHIGICYNKWENTGREVDICDTQRVCLRMGNNEEIQTLVFIHREYIPTSQLLSKEFP